MHRLLAPNGGTLVCLMFPVGTNHQGGPPYALAPQLYKDLLEPLGLTCTELSPVTDSFPGRQGKEFLGIFKRMDGPAPAAL
jgi:hypothetical protein